MQFDMAVFWLLILFVFGWLGMLLVTRLLSREISRERLHKVEDLSILWKMSFPPPQVLTDRGLKIQKWYRVYVVSLIIVAAAFGLWVKGFSMSPVT